MNMHITPAAASLASPRTEAPPRMTRGAKPDPIFILIDTHRKLHASGQAMSDELETAEIAAEEKVWPLASLAEYSR
jgi:hypothetical protein